MNIFSRKAMMFLDKKMCGSLGKPRKVLYFKILAIYDGFPVPYPFRPFDLFIFVIDVSMTS